MNTFIKSRKNARESLIDNLIKSIYNTRTPEFCFVCGGLRKIYVDAKDSRVRKMLLRRGFRYFSRNQFMVYALNSMLPIDTFIDIGVNFGECLFSVPFYSPVRIRGFEANPSLQHFIERSRCYNDDLADIVIVPAAMSDRVGEVIDFHIDTRWSGKSSALLDAAQQGVVTVKVPTTTIDHEIGQIGDVTTALIKIDVEGYEPKVLDGAAVTNASVANLIYLIEFDTEFLERGGRNPRKFYDGLRDRFTVYEFGTNGLCPAPRFKELLSRRQGGRKLHIDLVLTKFDDPDIRTLFETQIALRDLAGLRQSLWPGL